MRAKFLFGKAGTGKSRAARILLKNTFYNKLIINGAAFRKVKSKDLFKRLIILLNKAQKDTDLIYIDDFPAKHVDSLMTILFAESLIVNPMHKDPFTISPAFIIACECDFEQLEINASSAFRFDFITCIESQEHSVLMKLHHPIQTDDVFKKLF